MAIKLIKRNKLAVTVKGTLPDESGKPVNFDFKLHCKRLSQDEIDVAMKDKKGDVKKFVRDIAEGWDGVLSEAGVAQDFTPEEFDELIDNVGMPVVIMHAYLEQVAAVAKN
jgi:hypothetical protein